MLTPFQKAVIEVLATLRNEKSYCAGGAVLNVDQARLSDDIDIFHDDDGEVVPVAKQDIAALRAAGFRVDIELLQYGLADVVVRKNGDETRVQWMQETCHRFFPIQRDSAFGYRLHDVDLAVNKAVAAASRKKVRDIVDLVMIDENFLKLGPLVWAAAESKTPMSPGYMIDNIVHNAATHSSQEYRMVRARVPVDGAEILAKIRAACDEARRFCQSAPIETLGRLFVDDEGRAVAPTLREIEQGSLRPHAISENGAWPSLPDTQPPVPGARPNS